MAKIHRHSTRTQQIVEFLDNPTTGDSQLRGPYDDIDVEGMTDAK